MITIRIEGDRGAGAATVAVAIVRFLRKMGQNARYQGHSLDREKLVETMLSDDGPFRPMNERRDFYVLDLSTD